MVGFLQPVQLPSGIFIRPHTADGSAVARADKAWGPPVARRGDRVLDIGGHVGRYARGALLAGAAHARVLEPYPGAEAIINLTCYALPVEVVAAAVDDGESEGVFYIGDTASTIPEDSVFPRLIGIPPQVRHYMPGVDYLRVPTHNFITELWGYRPTVLKVDVVGYERRLDWSYIPTVVRVIQVARYSAQPKKGTNAGTSDWFKWEEEHPRIDAQLELQKFTLRSEVPYPFPARRMVVQTWERDDDLYSDLLTEVNIVSEAKPI